MDEEIERIREVSEALENIAKNQKRDRKVRIQIMEQVVALHGILEDMAARQEDEDRPNLDN